ncbi:MAG: conjugal transfer protein TraX [Oscillospiraceae bacterium]|nr:conjugal transfer protein TraX [Oscillospiraceae bacterium]
MALPKFFKGIDALTLKLMAMAFMLLDHMWATVWDVPWFTMIGRLAFPIFAFQIVEGFFHTSSRKRYMQRMQLFALISEIPFNLMVANGFVYPFHQNVMFTFLIALLLMSWMEQSKTSKGKFLLVTAVCVGLAYLLGLLTFVDYYHYGIFIVLLFYWTHGLKFGWVIQLLGMLYISDAMAGLQLQLELFGRTVEFGQQMLAVLALIPIWLYNGKQGYHSKAVQLLCYGFYPVHMLVLYLLAVLLNR